MAEVIRTVIGSVELELERPTREPVVVRGITMTPKYGTPAIVRRRRLPAAPAGEAAELVVSHLGTATTNFSRAVDSAASRSSHPRPSQNRRKR